MTSLKRDLFERRLWPLVIVIVAAIVAVPMLLHGHRANADVAAPPAATAGSSTSATSAGSHHAQTPTPRTAPTSRTRNPFEEAGVTAKSQSASSSASASSGGATTSVTSSASSAQSSGGSSGSAGAGPTSVSSSGGTPTSSSSSSETASPVTTPTTKAPSTKAPSTKTSTVTRQVSHSHKKSARKHRVTKSWDIYSVDVRVGLSGKPVTHRNLARLTPLPTERSPQVMYMGVTGHGRDAVFALGAGVQVRGFAGARSSGAACRPSHVDCALVVIPAGKSVGVSYVSATGKVHTFVLRLTRISSRVTQSTSAVNVARRHVSALGLCDLKLGDPIGFFDPAEASVKLVSTRACRSRKLAVPFPGSLGAGSSVRG